MSTDRPVVHFGGVVWPLASNEQRFRAHSTIMAQLKSMEYQAKQQCLTKLIHDLEPPPVEQDSALATMDWSEIHTLAATGLIDFGSHTHTHQILSRCTEPQQLDELRSSRDILREHLSRAEFFAYPNGTARDFTDVTKRALIALGYQCGLSTIPGLNTTDTDIYALKRVNVGADMALSDFEVAMAGL
jgi:peptidoglycan/xylan/chitin deacetylase (PgdA/CDA1 family)